MTKVFRNNLRYENMWKKGRVGVFRDARERTFRFAEKNASFQKGRTFRFADYTVDKKGIVLVKLPIKCSQVIELQFCNSSSKPPRNTFF